MLFCCFSRSVWLSTIGVILGFSLVLRAQPVEWTGGGDGSSWGDPLNWNPQQVPGETSAVSVPAPFAGTEIVISGENPIIASLEAAGSLRLAAGSLTINGSGQVGGELTLVNNTTLVIQGTGSTFSVAGGFTGADANLRAIDGGVIDLGGVNSLVRTANGNRSWEARGSGSLIDLSGLQNLIGRSSFGSTWTFKATGGGQIDLSALPSVEGGTLHFSASDPGSVIDLSAMTTFTSYIWNSTAGFTVVNEGTVLVPLLTSVVTANLVLDATATLSIGQIESWNSGTVIIDVPGLSFDSLIHLTNVRLELRGEVPSLPVLSNIDNSSIIVTGGAVLNLPLVTAYVNNSNATRELSATGTGSMIELPNLLTLQGYSYLSRNTDILATDGGIINLPAMTTVVDGAVWFKADGPGSAIQMPALGSFDGYFWNTRSGFSAVNSGTLSTPQLVDITQGDLVLDETGAMDIEQIQTWNTGTLIVDIPGLQFDSLTDLINVRLELVGQIPDLPVLSNIDSSSLLVSGGVTLNLPLVGSYVNDSNASRVLSATGSGSRLELPNLATLQGYSYLSRNTDILARTGGVIDLPALAAVTGGAVWFSADGPGSRVQLPSLASFDGYFWNTRSGFSATNEGVVDNPSLTDVIDADLDLDGTGSIDIAQVQTWHSGTITVNTPGVSFDSLTSLTNARLELQGEVPALPVLSNIDGSSLVVSGGVTLELPLVTTYVNTINASREITASGAGSTIRFPALTTVTGFSSLARNTVFSALDGGTLAFPELAEVPGGAVFFRSSGTGSLVDLPRLGSFNGYFWNTLSGFEAANDATLHLATELSSISVQRGTVTVMDTAAFTFPEIRLLAQATLMGDGVFQGNVLVDQGSINPGNPIGLLSIEGTVTLLENGRLAFDIGGLIPATEYDQLYVGGDLSLGGSLQTTLANDFAPAVGDLFTLAEWLAGSGDFLAYAGLDAGASTEFVPAIEGNLLIVEAQFASGAQVVEVSPEGIVGLELSKFEVVFSEAIDRASFSGNDVVVTGPSGSIPLNFIRRLSATRYEIHFDTQYDQGTYSLELLTTINDSAGNPLNQDGDQVNGEVEEDGFIHSVDLNESLLSDLVVTAIEAPPSAMAGVPVPVSWTVQNLRANPTGSDWMDALYLVEDIAGTNPRLIGLFPSGGPLEGNGSRERSFEVILPAANAGLRYLQIVTDHENEVPELTGELNNTSTDSDPLEVQAADLVVSAASLSPELLQWGESLEVNWTLQNTGTAPTVTTWTDRIYLADTGTLSFAASLGASDASPAAPLGPDETAQRSTVVTLPLPGSLPDGNYAVVVETNYNRRQSESDHGNNRTTAGTLSVTTAPLPDLRVSNVSAPATAESGQPVTISWTLHNAGDAITGAPVQADIFVSPSPALAGAKRIGSHQESADLEPGTGRELSTTLTLPGNTPNGAVYFIVKADPANTLIESNETNNTAASTNATEIPARLSLVLNNDTFPEDGEGNVSIAWLTRNGDTSGALEISLTSSDETEVTVPPSVTIPSGQQTVSVPLNPVDDALADGPQTVLLSALADGFPEAQATVTILDTDEPALSLFPAQSAIEEGESTPATVTIPAPVSSALTVFLTSSQPTRVVIPSSIVIPSGQTAFTFSIVARENGTPHSDRFLSIQADAEGYSAAESTLSITDDDLDTLVASLSRAVVSEGDGPAASVLTLTRSPVTAAPVRVQLGGSSSRLEMPAAVTIPGSSESVTVDLNMVDDTVINGEEIVFLTATVNDPDVNTPIAAADPVRLTIQDDDGPSLFLSLSRPLAMEDVPEAAVLTVSRNDGFGTALTVDLLSGDSTEATLPATVTIPAGEESAEVFVSSIADGETDGTQTLLLSASAEGFTGASVEFAVSDADLPELLITGLSVQAQADTESLFSLSYRLVNEGPVDTPEGFTQHLYLSDDPHLGDDVYLGAITLGSSLPAGESFVRSVSYFAPRNVGDYWVIAKADALDDVMEILENNNTAVSSAPMQVVSAYTATLSTDVDSVPAGTPIPLSGSAVFRANGAPAPNVIVSIQLNVRDTKRVFAAITDATGQFQTTFYPLPTEGGLYTIGAAHPGEPDAPEQDSFQILGILPTPSEPTVELLADGEASTVVIELQNLADVALTGLAAGSPELPAGLTASIWFGSEESAEDALPALGSLSMGIQFTATEAAPASARILFPVITAEGVTINIPVEVTVKRLRPVLEADVDSLYASLLNGAGEVASFRLSNTGGAPTGPIAISPPASLPWIQPVNGGELPSLAPGESIDVGFSLVPPEDLGLGEYAGTIGFNAEYDSFSLPFNILNLSDATGDLVVYTENELTYYAEGAPRIANAQVSLRDYFSGEIAAEGVTNEAGLATFTGVNEGYYELEIIAEKHNTFRETVLVEAGTLNEVTAFLPYQSITYNWTVVPTTIEDRYKIVVETVFETNLPIPVVTVEPAYVDLDELTEPVTQIDFTLTNQGLLAAENTRFRFFAPTGWRITPLIEEIGTLPAKSSITIPVIFTNLEQRGFFRTLSGGSCGGGLVTWTVDCGPGAKGGISAIGIAGSGDADCGGINPVGGGNPGGSGGGAVFATGGSGNCIDGEDACVAKSLILCGIGLIPVPGACAPGVLDCLFSFNPETLAVSGLSCALAGAGCLPFLNVPANLLLCGASLSLCHAGTSSASADVIVPYGTISGGDAFEGYSAVTSNDEMQFYAVELERYISLAEDAYAYHLLLFGSEAWFNGLLGSNYADWNERLQLAVAEESESASRISTVERDLLLADPLPEGLTGSQVAVFIDRWNNGLDYAEQGILREADLPEGMDPNFLPILDLQDAAALYQAAHAQAQVDGFIDPWDGLIYYRDQLLARLGTDYSQRPLVPGSDIAPKNVAGGVCARVRLRIEQEAVLTRDAFDAQLEIINETDLPMDTIEVSLMITDEAGNDATHLFQLREPKLRGIDAVDGQGFLFQGETGSTQWIIVPTPEAAPQFEVTYYVSGVLRYTYDGVPVNVPLEEAPINVLPTPSLSLKYFHQRDVFSDDPFTDEVEPKIPFALGIIVENRGAGTARDFTITSSQPKIVDNEKGLLVDFQIIATQVDGQPLLPSLTASFGDIEPGGRSVGQWLMTSTIQGLFIEYSATFQHVDAFGDERLSLIDSVEIIEMIRPVSGDGDLLTDFLANELPDDDDFPDRLYLGNGDIFWVSVSTNGDAERAPAENSLSVGLSAEMEPGWTYLRLPDPSEGDFILTKIVRTDGTEVPPANFWQTDRTFVGEGRPPVREDRLHLLDKDSDGQYTLVYALPATADVTPPQSAVNALPAASPAEFNVSWQGSDDTAVRDYSLFVSTDGGPFVPWLQNTTLTRALFTGEIDTTYAFYSVARDISGNAEAAPAVADASTVTSIVNTPPLFDALANRTIGEGERLDLIIGAADPDSGQSLRFALVGEHPVGMTIDSGSGQLSWQTGETHGGTSWNIEVSARDSGVPTAESITAFTLSVLETNRLPTVVPPDPRRIDIGNTLAVDILATDDDLPEQSLSWSLGLGVPEGVTLEPDTGFLTWTPTLEDLGNHDIVVVVSDGTDDVGTVLPVEVTLPENYHAWKEFHWPRETDLQVVGFLADPDGDDIRNLEEYALGLDPRTWEVTENPWVELDFSNPPFYLRMGYVSRIDDPRLRVEVIATTDLSAPESEWEVIDNVIETSEFDLPFGFREFIVEDPADDSTYENRFIRLRYRFD